MTPAQAMADIWQGFRDVGVMNGLPAVPPQVTRKPTHSASAYATIAGEGYDPDHDPSIPLVHHYDADGRDMWRHIGLGSV